MPTDTKQESRRAIAKRLVNERAAMSGDAYACDLKLIDAIEAALKERDERAVRLIREHREQDICRENCWTAISNAIRNEDTNAAR